MLLSFIEAHEYAQRKVQYYLGPDEYINTPEESALVGESKELVRLARDTLDTRYSSETLRRILSKNIASVLLHSEEGLIYHFHEEGILSASDAAFLESFPREDLKSI